MIFAIPRFIRTLFIIHALQHMQHLNPIRRKIWKSVLSAALALVATFLSVHALGAPVRGGTLNFVIDREASTLMPLASPAFAAQAVGTKIFEGLLTYDRDTQPLPELATAWKISPDGLEYRFELRKGVLWHDGKPLTSADVAFSIERLKQVHPRGRVTFANIQQILTPDASTVVLKLSQTAPNLISSFASSESPIVPKHIFEAVKPTVNPADAQLVGTGPFRFVEWSRGSHVILDRNPQYWAAGKPYLDRIIFHFSQDAAARVAGFETRKYDVGADGIVPLAEVARLQKLSHLTVDNQPAPYAGAHRQLALNLDNPYLKDVRVRKAIAHAVNLEGLKQLFYLGHGEIAPSAISPSLKAFNDPSIRPYKYDLALANQLLDEAGFRRKPDGIRFSLRLLINPAAGDAKFTDFVKQSLKPVGVDVQIALSDQATFIKRAYTDRAFDLVVEALANLFDPAVGVHRVYFSDAFRVGLPFSNPSHYSNPEVDRILTEAGVQTDPVKRRALYFAFQRIVHDDLPVINLYNPPNFRVKQRYVHNDMPGAHAHLWNFADVYIDKEGNGKND